MHVVFSPGLWAAFIAFVFYDEQFRAEKQIVNFHPGPGAGLAMSHAAIWMRLFHFMTFSLGGDSSL